MSEILGRCDKKQYEHCGPHPRYADVGQGLPPFGCVNWKADVTDKGSVQHEPELIRMLRLRKELYPDAPDAIVLPESESSKLAEIREWREANVSGKAREALIALRDATRDGRQLDFKERDPLVMTIFQAVDANDTLLSIIDDSVANERRLALRVVLLEQAASNMKTELIKRVREKAEECRFQALGNLARESWSDRADVLNELATELESIEVNDLSGR